MALRIPQDAYASVSDVEALVLRDFPSSGPQSETAIEGFLRDGKQRIDGALRSILRQLGSPQGFTSEHGKALELVRPINADYAAERVFGSQRERFPAGNTSTRWREDLKAIRQGDVDLGTEDDGTFIGSFGGETYSDYVYPSDTEEPVVVPVVHRFFGWFDYRQKETSAENPPQRPLIIEAVDLLVGATQTIDNPVGLIPDVPDTDNDRETFYIWFVHPDTQPDPIEVLMPSASPSNPNVRSRNSFRLFAKQEQTILYPDGQTYVAWVSKRKLSRNLVGHSITLRYP